MDLRLQDSSDNNLSNNHSDSNNNHHKEYSVRVSKHSNQVHLDSNLLILELLVMHYNLNNHLAVPKLKVDSHLNNRLKHQDSQALPNQQVNLLDLFSGSPNNNNNLNHLEV